MQIVTDDRLIESANVLEGKSVSLASLAVNPGNWRYLWNPFQPSWGEPYTEVVGRMQEVMDQAREAARGQEAVCVSHQLPIWVSRLAAEHRRLWHNPKRQAVRARLGHQLHLRRRPAHRRFLRRAAPAAGCRPR